MRMRDCPLLILLLIALLSCHERSIEGHGTTATAQRSIAQGFTRIAIDAPVNAHIRISPGAGSVTLSGYDNLLRYIKTEVRDSTLHISVPDQLELHTDHKVEATISCPALRALAVSGTASASISDALSVNSFSAETSGTAAVIIDQLQADHLSVDATGASTFAITTGKAREAEYNASGTARVMTNGMESDRAAVSVSGTSKTNIAATAALTIEASGAASLQFSGDPKLTADVSGTATVSRADGTPVATGSHHGEEDDDDDDDDTTTRDW